MSVKYASTQRVRQRPTIRGTATLGGWRGSRHPRRLVSKMATSSTLPLLLPPPYQAPRHPARSLILISRMTPNHVPTLMSHLWPLAASQHPHLAQQTQSVPSCPLSAHLCHPLPSPQRPSVHPLWTWQWLVFLTPRPQRPAPLQGSQRKKKPRSFSTAPCAK